MRSDNFEERKYTRLHFKKKLMLILIIESKTDVDFDHWAKN